MDKTFIMGLAIGMIGGALIVVNCKKARNIIKKSQDEVMEKVNTAMDEKLKTFEDKSSSCGCGTDYNQNISED